MIKRISILTRKEGMSKEEFLKHWKDHLPIAHAVPEMRRYVIDHIKSQPQRPDVPLVWDMGDVDGIAETRVGRSSKHRSRVCIGRRASAGWHMAPLS